LNALGRRDGGGVFAVLNSSAAPHAAVIVLIVVVVVVVVVAAAAMVMDSGQKKGESRWKIASTLSPDRGGSPREGKQVRERR